MRNLLSRFTPVILGASAAVLVGILPAAASTQFIVRVQAPNRILTTQHLHIGEVLHVGLDGQAVTVTAEQFLGGGTVAWVSPFLFVPNVVGKSIVVSG